MNPLIQEIHERIAARGPMRVADYMKLCLHHPVHGYYKKNLPIGTDFVTSPEISPLFGQVIGISVLQQWVNLGKPSKWRLVELGPGRGSLMVDILQVLSYMPEAVKGLRLTMVESNPHFTEMQKTYLKRYPNIKVSWASQFDGITIDGPHVVVGNEFLDALPVQSFTFKEGKFWPDMVARDGAGLSLVRGERPEEIPAYWRDAHGYAEGNVIEVCDALHELLIQLGRGAGPHPGEYIFIDYGYTQRQTERTLQAMQRHEHVDICEDPGNADITAHVNFRALGELARVNGFQHHVTSQRLFLKEFGIDLRLQKLVETHPQKQQVLTQGYNRLIDVMGDLFKVAHLRRR